MATESGSLGSARRCAVAALGLLLVASGAQAQVQQTLTVTFDTISGAVPLSDWATAGVALLLAATAFVALRRQGGRRFFSWVLVLVTGGVLLAANGPRIVSDAKAAAVSDINLVVSPASVVVPLFAPPPPSVLITVNNTTGKVAQISGIALTPSAGTYIIVPGDSGTCSVGLTLPVGGSCQIKLTTQS